jgi:hypothetical protein
MTVGQLRELLRGVPADLPVRIEFTQTHVPQPSQVYEATGVLQRDVYLAICANPVPAAAGRPIVSEHVTWHAPVSTSASR